MRIYRANWRSREEIEIEIAILLHLAREKARVSIPVSRKDGQVITPLDCVEGGRWAALFTCAPGKEVASPNAYNYELAWLYGEAVATIHSAADSFEGRRPRPALDLAELLERPLRLLTSTIVHRREDVAYINGLGDRLRQVIERESTISFTDVPPMKIAMAETNLEVGHSLYPRRRDECRPLQGSGANRGAD